MVKESRKENRTHHHERPPYSSANVAGLAACNRHVEEHEIVRTDRFIDPRPGPVVLMGGPGPGLPMKG
jgi:hypothetical protein